MAFVFEREGSKYWYAGYVGANGKQVRVSTKLRLDLFTKKKALSMASKLEDAAHLASRGIITQSRGTRLVSEMVEVVTGAPIDTHSVASWLEDWLQGKRSTKQLATFQSYRGAVANFLAHIGPERANRGLALLTVRDFQSFRDKQLKDGKTPQTANSLIQKLRIPLNSARRQGIIPTNPAEAVENLPIEKVSRRTFSPDQLRALVGAADNEWQGVILSGIYTGQRLRDVTKLRWEAVDLQSLAITFIQGKTKRRVVMPIHAELETWLKGHATRRSEKSFVFPSLAALITGGSKGLSNQFKAIMEKAGIEAVRARERSSMKGTKGRSLNALSFHCLRHTFNSIMANAGVSQEVRQELTGHASADMNRIYTHHELRNLRAAVDTLPLLSTIKTPP